MCKIYMSTHIYIYITCAYSCVYPCMCNMWTMYMDMYICLYVYVYVDSYSRPLFAYMNNTIWYPWEYHTKNTIIPANLQLSSIIYHTSLHIYAIICTWHVVRYKCEITIWIEQTNWSLASKWWVSSNLTSSNMAWLRRTGLIFGAAWAHDWKNRHVVKLPTQPCCVCPRVQTKHI